MRKYCNRLKEAEAGGSAFGCAGKPLDWVATIDLSLAHEMPMAFAELELGIVGAGHAFQRWIASSIAATRLKDLAIADALILHQLSQRASDKRLADICFILNIEDTHVVAYSLRKLMKLGVVKADKQGKEVTYSVTLLGQEYLERHQEIRNWCLLSSIDALRLDPAALKKLARLLRKMSGLYDQAARAATSI